MSRQIKFRAWDKTLKTMIKTFMVYSNGIVHEDSGWDKHYAGLDITDRVELMQFTGLHDKNGKEIYEWDIVKGTEDNEHQGQSAVFYGNFHIQPFSYLGCYDGAKFEVIGNIYENPELLEANNG